MQATFVFLAYSVSTDVLYSVIFHTTNSTDFQSSRIFLPTDLTDFTFTVNFVSYNTQFAMELVR